MSARSVIAKAISGSSEPEDYWCERAAEVIEELAIAGHTIVQLPAPDSTRYEGDEYPAADRSAWLDIGYVFAVSVWNYPEVQISVEDEPLEPISIGEARRLAAALLAAAATAEALRQGEAGGVSGRQNIDERNHA